MCGRFALRSSADELARQFSLADVPLLAPNDNIAPSARVLAVRTDGATLLRWGLKGKMHNLRGETAAGKFARAYATGRCLLPASADSAVSAEPLASEIDATGGSGNLFGD